MKKTKKISCLILIVMLTLNFLACSKDTKKDSEPAESTSVEAPTEVKMPEDTKPEETETVVSEEDKAEEKQPESETNNKTPEKNNKTENKNPETSKPESNDTQEEDNSVNAEAKVSEFVNKNGKNIEEKGEKLFLSKTGMTCDCTVKANGTKLVLYCNINGLDDLVDSDKTKIQILAGSIKSMLKKEFKAYTEDIPEITGADFKICEEDGDLIATVSI